MGRQLASILAPSPRHLKVSRFHVKQSKQSARRRIVKTKVAKKTFRATVGPFILAERLRSRKPAAKGRIAVCARGVKKRVLGAVCDCWVSLYFWCQKYNKSSKRANKRSGIDNQAVFRFGSPCRSFRMDSRRHRRTKVRFSKHYLVRKCFSFHKTVIFRLLHFRSS